VCDDCDKLLEENKRLLDHVMASTCPHCEELQFKYAALDEERCGLILTVRKVSAEVVALRREANPPEASELDKDIRFVLTRWRRLCGHPKAKCPVDGKAWKAVKRALVSWEYTMMEVLEAVEGAALAPYDAGYGRRKVTGTPRERKDDLGYVLRDETNIAKFRDIAQRARKATVDQLLQAQQAAAAADELYTRLLLDALNRENSWTLQLAQSWHYSRADEVAA
jgi:hypothetical protein